MIALDLNNRIGLAVRMMADVFHRTRTAALDGRRDPAVKRLARHAWEEAGYCLDAPDTLPAGGCRFDSMFGPEPIVMQITCERGQ